MKHHQDSLARTRKDTVPATTQRLVSACAVALCLLPLAACEPRFGEGNTTPRTPPTQPTPGTGTTTLPAVPGQ